MAYILGFIVTDGCLVEHANGYHGLDITSRNDRLLALIKKEMRAGHKIGKKTRGYRLQIRNRKIYNDLLKLGLTPRKSKILRFPVVLNEFLADFIRGCFDGDGSIIVWRDPRWKHPWQIRTVFCSGSHIFLDDMQKRLREVAGLSNGSIQKSTRSHNLCYSIADSVKLYNFMYSNKNDTVLYISDKLKKFKFFRRIRPDVFN